VITQYALTANEWTPIGIAGQSGACWLDEDGDGAQGAVDVRILTASTPPILTVPTPSHWMSPNHIWVLVQSMVILLIPVPSILSQFHEL